MASSTVRCWCASAPTKAPRWNASSAQVSASDHGRQLTTLINLNRLAFSQFTQMVDRWDPMVQLHDDEIVGRFHTNSRFNLMYDSRTAPKFLGKVTTAARSFNTESVGRRRESDIFRGGIETGTSNIELPETLAAVRVGAARRERARARNPNDTRIRFFADGSYAGAICNTLASRSICNEPAEHADVFPGDAAGDAARARRGRGKVLVYSPQQIVIEGSLTYAHDPRDRPDPRTISDWSAIA